jgi:hypothetical protein
LVGVFVGGFGALVGGSVFLGGRAGGFGSSAGLFGGPFSEGVLDGFSEYLGGGIGDLIGGSEYLGRGWGGSVFLGGSWGAFGSSGIFAGAVEGLEGNVSDDLALMGGFGFGEIFSELFIGSKEGVGVFPNELVGNLNRKIPGIFTGTTNFNGAGLCFEFSLEFSSNGTTGFTAGLTGTLIYHEKV